MLGVIGDDEYHGYQQFVVVFLAKMLEASQAFVGIIVFFCGKANVGVNTKNQRLIEKMVHTYCVVSYVLWHIRN